MLYSTTSILTWPLMLLVCELDIWLVFALLILAARHFAVDRFSYQSSLLCLIVEGPVQVVRQRIEKWWRRAVPSWVPWAATFAVVIVLRHVLACVLSTVSQSG